MSEELSELPLGPAKAAVARALEEAGDTRYLHVAKGALDEVPALLTQAFGNVQAVVIADDNTFAAAGSRVDGLLRDAGRAAGPPIVFPGEPPLYAERPRLEELEAALAGLSAVPVVVGSGTLNDLTKLAAHRLERPYLCVATAASVDGYCSFGAIVTEDGFKRTLPCPAPVAVVADLDVLREAPGELNAAGYGDLIGKITAGADWLLADALGIEPIDAGAWALVQGHLREWTGRPSGVRGGDSEAIELLFEGLSATGLAMQHCSSSRPASGSEHRFSHLWEMQALGRGEPPVLHGFKVAVGTLASTSLYDLLLEADLTRLDVAALLRSWPSGAELERRVRAMHADPRIAEQAVGQSLEKHVDAAEQERRLSVLMAEWPELVGRLREQLLPARELRELLREAGCPTRPEEVGLSADLYRESFALARTIRSRYTVLDLAADVGLLAGLVDRLFAPGGFWHAAAESAGG